MDCGRNDDRHETRVIIYFFLALVVLNPELTDAKPELKGGTFQTHAACNERLEQVRALYLVKNASACQPIVLLEVAPTP